MHIDLDIIVYAVIAIVLLGRLWFVFGTRNEDERQRPNPFIPLPPKPAAGNPAFTAPQAAPVRVQPELPPASLAGGLAQVAALDQSFDEKQFLSDARTRFTAIVETYATGTLDRIAPMLSPPLLAHFQQAADARRAAGQSAQTRVARIKDAEVTAARADGTTAFITVKFISEQENILRDSGGTIIGGIEGRAEEVTDVWTFSRAPKTPDAKWVVVETGG